MRLTTTAQVSVDGVMQGGGARDEDRSGGFERGGWARPLGDNEARTYINQVYQRADAFLFGRRTYELFAEYWGVRKDLVNPIVGDLNTKPKYVASNTLTDPGWADTTVLSAEPATAIGELKAKPGGELQVHGSGVLTRWLLENELVDAMNLLVCPVIVGQGTRLFPGNGPDIALDLDDSRAFPRGNGELQRAVIRGSARLTGAAVPVDAGDVRQLRGDLERALNVLEIVGDCRLAHFRRRVPGVRTAAAGCQERLRPGPVPPYWKSVIE
jgi:dihydrofolate reductase